MQGNKITHYRGDCMKTVFVVNPCAGSRKGPDSIIENIKNTSERLGAQTEVYITKSVGDAERFVREYCRDIGAARFVACGGDGTLNEVVNGAIACPDAEVGVMPLGTGNDFCRNFPDAGDFLSIEAQIEGESIPCDAIRYTSTLDGKEKVGYCVNMFNIGFDCNVADMTSRMKQKPLISGSLAYFLSIFAILIKKKGANLKIVIDGEEKHNGKLLLTSVANGRFCGGGIMSNPLASVTGGEINVNIVKNVSRLKFVSLLPSYMKGTHMSRKGIDKIICSVNCHELSVNPLDGKMRLCIDGEITDAGDVRFEIVKGAFCFVVPKKCVNRN